MEKAKNRTYSIKGEVVRFIVVGVIATIFDFLTKLLSAKLLEMAGLDGEIYEKGLFSLAGANYTISIILGFVIGVLINYLLSRFWVFQNVADKKKTESASSFFLFVLLGFIGMLISLAIFWGAVFLVPLMINGIDIYEGSKSISLDFKFLTDANFWAYFIVFCISTLIVLVWNYLSRKKWIFKAPEEEKEIKKEEPKPAKTEIKEETKKKEEAPKKEEPAPKKETKKVELEAKTVGKYEVYPEAGGYKFRLKANNGEILVVSGGYTTKAGAHKGIDTFKKNIPNGTKSVQSDKSGYSQWKLFTENDGRLIASGEIYPTADGAYSALASVEKFYLSDKIIDLKEIPNSEIRDWAIDLGKITAKAGGKLDYSIEDGFEKWRARLYANNGQLLFVTDGTYASKAGAQNAVAAIRKQIAANQVHVLKDKQGRYQFQIANAVGAVLVRGESYDDKTKAISAANSVASFLKGIKETKKAK